MPDILLEKILHYSTASFPDVLVLDVVCKRIRRMTKDNEDFWARHPLGAPKHMNKLLATSKTVLPFGRDNSHGIEWSPADRLTRNFAFEAVGLSLVNWYQDEERNAIIDVFGGDADGVQTFRNVAAGVLSRMSRIGETIHFRLRGDTVGYLADLLEAYMVERLAEVLLIAVQRCGNMVGWAEDEDEDKVEDEVDVEVERNDVSLIFQQAITPAVFLPLFESQQSLLQQCNVGADEHGRIDSVHGCSCSLPSLSGTVWRWPLDDCCDVLPPEAGRRIIRRIAYKAGIIRMTNEAFILAEAQLLHTMGCVLVEAYESSVKMNMPNKIPFLDVDDVLVYNHPGLCTNDMFKVPPPPFDLAQESIDEESGELGGGFLYTIVPGQIFAAAKKRHIAPYRVYGDVWRTSPGFTKEEEMEIEESYYYRSFDDDESSEDSSNKGEGDVSGDDYVGGSSCTSVRSDDAVIGRYDYEDGNSSRSDMSEGDAGSYDYEDENSSSCADELDDDMLSLLSVEALGFDEVFAYLQPGQSVSNHPYYN